MAENNKLSSNMEDYLETIVVLKEKDGVVRVKKISDLIKVTKASVSSALKNLSKKGYVLHEKYGYVELTSKGQKIAEKIKKRHDMLIEFLENILGLEKKLAEEDACKIEHVLSPETSNRLSKFVEFVETVPGGDKPEWVNGFSSYLKTGKRSKCKYKKIK